MPVAIARRQGPFQNVAAASQVFEVAATVSAQRLVAVVTMKGGPTSSITSVSSESGTWVSLGTSAVAGSSTRISIFENRTASASQTTITATPSASAAVSLDLYEITGSDTAVDGSGIDAADATSDTAWTGATLTPAAATWLLIAGISTNATNAGRTVSAVTSGWDTARWLSGTATIQSIGTTSRIVTTDGVTSYPITFTGSSAQTNGAVTAQIPELTATGVVLDGSVTAASSSSATQISEAQPLAASSPGTSTSAATRISEDQPLSTYAAGTSASSATGITTAHPLAGSLPATSSATATQITESHPLASTAAATSTSAATRIVLDHPVAGASAGVSPTTATRVTESHPLAGSVAGASATTGNLAGASAHPLAGSVSATSSAGATRVSTSHALAGSVAATAAASAVRLVFDHLLTGSAAGVASAAAWLSLSHPLNGSTLGASTGSGSFAPPPLTRVRAFIAASESILVNANDRRIRTFVADAQESVFEAGE